MESPLLHPMRRKVVVGKHSCCDVPHPTLCVNDVSPAGNVELSFGGGTQYVSSSNLRELSALFLELADAMEGK